MIYVLCSCISYDSANFSSSKLSRKHLKWKEQILIAGAKMLSLNMMESVVQTINHLFLYYTNKIIYQGARWTNFILKEMKIVKNTESIRIWGEVVIA